MWWGLGEGGAGGGGKERHRMRRRQPEFTGREEGNEGGFYSSVSTPRKLTPQCSSSSPSPVAIFFLRKWLAVYVLWLRLLLLGCTSVFL